MPPHIGLRANRVTEALNFSAAFDTLIRRSAARRARLMRAVERAADGHASTGKSTGRAARKSKVELLVNGPEGASAAAAPTSRRKSAHVAGSSAHKAGFVPKPSMLDLSLSPPALSNLAAAEEPQSEEAAATPTGDIADVEAAPSKFRPRVDRLVLVRTCSSPTSDEAVEAPWLGPFIKQFIQREVAISQLWLSYRSLVFFTIFFSVFCLTLVNLRRPEDTYDSVSIATSAFVPGDDGLFTQESEVLQWLGAKVDQIWDMQQCGDDVCDFPFEFPAFGQAGCKVDCGAAVAAGAVLVSMWGDFRLSPLGAASAGELRAGAGWNLCVRDVERLAAGLPEACWFSVAQKFETVVFQTVQQFEVPQGEWYIRLTGDYYRLVLGSVFHQQNASAPVLELPTSPAWESCRVQPPPLLPVASPPPPGYAWRRQLRSEQQDAEDGPRGGAGGAAEEASMGAARRSALAAAAGGVATELRYREVHANLSSTCEEGFELGVLHDAETVEECYEACAEGRGALAGCQYFRFQPGREGCSGCDAEPAMCLLSSSCALQRPHLYTGSTYGLNPEGCVELGALRKGVAVTERTSGPGYLMYSVESVQDRLDMVKDGQAEHFVAVRVSAGGGGWEYDTNHGWLPFASNASDVLVAELAFGSPVSAELLEKRSFHVAGVQAGYRLGNLTLLPGFWNGNRNPEELMVEGNFFC
ncbi:hypothetical protein CYMTET_19537, partial [Cymbomonas tetramitiformis]